METSVSLTIRIESAQKLISDGEYSVDYADGAYTLSILPAANMYGAGNVNLIATDPEGLSDTIHFIQVVQPTNDPPDPYSGTMTFMQGDQVSTYTLTANDIDGDLVQFIIVDDTAAGGMLTLTQRNLGICSYTPDDTISEQEYYFDFKAFDGLLDSSPAEFISK
jgi:hypothetical protein